MSSTNFTLLGIFFRSDLYPQIVSSTKSFCGIANYIRTNHTPEQQRVVYFIWQKMTEILSYTASRQLSQMFVVLFFFHSSEYILALTIHGRSNVTLSSLLISTQYILAMIFSLLEYIVEITLFPELKEHWVISNLGLALVVIGEIIRKTAIITAGKSFTHLIRIYPDENHQLITGGIYRFMRHPGYCGFLIWSVGTQIMLCNPISVIVFTVVVWHFFAKRIPYEEFFLRQFFGSQYVEYAQRVGSGVPFVK